MVLEVKKLRETRNSELGWGDCMRKTNVLAPFIILVYCLILKGGVLDGWRGWYHAFQRIPNSRICGESGALAYNRRYEELNPKGEGAWQK